MESYQANHCVCLVAPFAVASGAPGILLALANTVHYLLCGKISPPFSPRSSEREEALGHEFVFNLFYKT